MRKEKEHLRQADAPLFVLFADAGGDDLANIPGAGGMEGSGFPLSLIGIAKLGRTAAAIQAFHIQAPAVFLLHQAGAAADGAVEQFDIVKIAHDEISFGLDSDADSITRKYRKYKQDFDER